MTKLRVEAYARTKSSGTTAINSVWAASCMIRSGQVALDKSEGPPDR
jgi:hypothetical protein